MKKSKKINDLIHILVNQTNYITVNELAKSIQVSSRTIHNYLDSPEFSTLIHTNEIEKKPNLGIRLKLSSSRKVKILSKLRNNALVPVTKNDFDDFTFILIQLFTEKDYLSFASLENSLYKSSSGIQNIIQEIESFASQFSCEIVHLRNKGIKLQGSESDIRSLFLFVLTDYTSFEDRKQQLNRISTHTESILDTFFHISEKEQLLYLTEVCETAMNTTICENDYNLLLLFLMIIILRLRNNFYSNEPNDKSIQNSVEFQYAILLKFHIEQKFHVEFPENELYYLSRILMSTRKQTNVITEDSESNVISQFISLVGNRLNIDLSQDKELSRNLNTHLRPAINRMKQGIPFSNPLLDYIKNDYTEVYVSVLTTIDDLEKLENIYFDSNEIGYICLHIIAAINRPENASSLKTALICSEGLSIELFLSNIIESYFKEIEITEVYRSSSIDNLQPDKFNLIINSTNVEVEASNVINVSTSLQHNDFNTIKHFISSRAFENDLKKSYLYKYLVFFRMHILSQEEFIKKNCNYLQKNGYVTQNFSSTVFERQRKSTTYVARGIAVLHGSKEEVIQPTVMITNLENEIEWDGYKVHTVIFIISNATNPTVFSQLLRQIMRIASSDELTDRLYACKSLNDIYELLEDTEEKNTLIEY